MDNGAKLLIGLGLATVIGIGGYQMYANNEKKEVIASIMLLGAMIPNFDASPEVMATMPLKELKALLLQMKQDFHSPPI